jgi:hypothetical protein
MAFTMTTTLIWAAVALWLAGNYALAAALAYRLARRDGLAPDAARAAAAVWPALALRPTTA